MVPFLSHGRASGVDFKECPFVVTLAVWQVEKYQAEEAIIKKEIVDWWWMERGCDGIYRRRVGWPLLEGRWKRYRFQRMPFYLVQPKVLIRTFIKSLVHN